MKPREWFSYWDSNNSNSLDKDEGKFDLILFSLFGVIGSVQNTLVLTISTQIILTPPNVVVRALVKTFKSVGSEGQTAAAAVEGGGGRGDGGAHTEATDADAALIVSISETIDCVWCLFDDDGSNSIDIDEFTRRDGLCETIIASLNLR